MDAVGTDQCSGGDARPVFKLHGYAGGVGLEAHHLAVGTQFNEVVSRQASMSGL
jgi:hypothetical protein